MPSGLLRPELARVMGRWTLTALVLNSIIGSGIFGLPSAIAGQIGPAAPWAYVIAAVAIGAIVAVFAELAAQFRDTGGQYLYARVALGRFAGIQIGWFSWLVRLTSAGAVANLFVVYLGEFWPESSTPWVRAALLAVIVGGLTAMNYRGVHGGARLATLFTLAKLVPLALFIVAGFWLGPGHAPAPLAEPATLGRWLDALVALMFAYGGFEAAVIPAAETRNPGRDAPFALYVGLAVVTAIYLLVHLVVMRSVPDLAGSQRPLADAARTFAGPYGAAGIALGAMLSTLGWLSGAFVTAPRLTHALAEQGDFPRVFAAVHPRFQTPYVSIVLWAVLVLALAVYGSFLWNALLSVAARLVTYAASCVALIQLRRRHPDATTWRVPGGRWLAAIGLAFCALLVTQMTAGHARIMAVVAIVAFLNWLAVRQRPLSRIAPKTA